MTERSTFSPVWHRVRSMKPRLRPHVQITRQHYRGRRWHVVHDPTSNNFYRLSPVAHEFVGLLDGQRTVEEVWHATLETHGDASPTQTEVVELLSQLYSSNLLSADTSPETEQLLHRGRQRRKQKVAQQALGIMYFRLKLFNPDWFLTKIEPIFRPLINRWGFLLWLCLIAGGLWKLLSNFEEFTGGFDNAIAPANWPWLIVVFIVTKAFHETGHGVICKRFGGLVPEFGVMLLVLFPAPYVDASACWAFPSRWKRMAVGAGGMIFELAIATIAVFIWAESEGLVKQVAYNVIFTASISTVLFNANPLMRFDGYYILSDLLEIPNLMQRSMKLIQHQFKRHLFGMKNSKPPTSEPVEAGILMVYGVAAIVYRVFLFFSITLYVMGKLFGVGLVLAIWTAGAWFLIPAGKFVQFLAGGHQLQEKRGRAIFASIALAALVIVVLGVIPMPNHRRADGVVETATRTGVFFANPGFVTRVHVRPGQRVKAGDPIITCESPDLAERINMLESDVIAAEGRWRHSLSREPGAIDIAAQQIATRQRALEKLYEKREKLVVVAPHDGVVVGEDPITLDGAFVQQGQPICEIVDTENVRVIASLPSLVARPLLERTDDAPRYGVEIRRFSRPDTTIEGERAEIVDSGTRQLPHAALGFAGGGQIQTEQDRTGLTSRERVFPLRVYAARKSELGLPGERVSLRFTLEPQPLLTQWASRLHRLIRERMEL